MVAKSCIPKRMVETQTLNDRIFTTAFSWWFLSSGCHKGHLLGVSKELGLSTFPFSWAATWSFPHLIVMCIHGYSWIFMDIHGYSWIFMVKICQDWPIAVAFLGFTAIICWDFEWKSHWNQVWLAFWIEQFFKKTWRLIFNQHESTAIKRWNHIEDQILKKTIVAHRRHPGGVSECTTKVSSPLASKRSTVCAVILLAGLLSWLVLVGRSYPLVKIWPI